MGGVCFCAVPQLAATRDSSSPDNGEYVRSKIVEPSIAHAIDVQTKMNTRAPMRLTMIFSLMNSTSRKEQAHCHEFFTAGISESSANKPLTKIIVFYPLSPPTRVPHL